MDASESRLLSLVASIRLQPPPINLPLSITSHRPCVQHPLINNHSSTTKDITTSLPLSNLLLPSSTQRKPVNNQLHSTSTILQPPTFNMADLMIKPPCPRSHNLIQAPTETPSTLPTRPRRTQGDVVPSGPTPKERGTTNFPPTFLPLYQWGYKLTVPGRCQLTISSTIRTSIRQYPNLRLLQVPPLPAPAWRNR